MRGTFKQKYRATIRYGFVGVGRWWQASRLKRWGLLILHLVQGSRHFFFGAGQRRTLIEASLLGMGLFWLVGNVPVVVDYRLLAIQYLPGGLLASLWATMRLRKLAPGMGGRQLGRRLLLTPLYGLLLNAWVVGLAFGLSAARYSLSDLAAPVVPDLFDNPSNPIIGNLAGVIMPLLSWPGQFDLNTPLWWIVAVRLLVYAAELTVWFLAGRLLVGLVAIPGRWLRRLNERRLLWRLTFSHFWVVLISMVAAGLALVGLVTGSPRSSVGRPSQPHDHRVAAYSARAIADTIRLENFSSPLSPTELSAFLRQLTFNPFEAGAAYLSPFNPPARVRDMVNELPPSNGLVRPIFEADFIVVTDLQGGVIASSSPVRLPVGKSFLESSSAQAAPTRWNDLLTRARAGETDPARLNQTQLGPPLLIAGAYPILGREGRPEQILLLSQRPEIAVLYSGQGLLGLLGIGAFFVVGTLSLSFTTVFVALLFGYFSSRRLVRNLERLSSAADALAMGNLAQRVPLDGQDEVNRLATRFNLMAYRLQQSQVNLEQEKHKAEQALQDKRDLIANVSHELRTPVSTIRAHVDWLLLSAEGMRSATGPAADAGSSPLDSKELYNYLDIIERETVRLGAMIEDLLDLSRIESHGPTVGVEAVDLIGLIGEVKQALGLMAQRERKIKIWLDLPTSLPAACADRTRLMQVLLNLTRNAVNYTPPGGIVSIGASQTDPTHVTLWVADTGIGIASDELSRVFERFYRSDASRSRNTGGAGLGLAIVKALVEAMGGTIAVESVVGEGSKFSVTLPVAKDRPSNPANIAESGQSLINRPL